MDKSEILQLLRDAPDSFGAVGLDLAFKLGDPFFLNEASLIALSRLDAGLHAKAAGLLHRNPRIELLPALIKAISGESDAAGDLARLALMAVNPMLAMESYEGAPRPDMARIHQELLIAKQDRERFFDRLTEILIPYLIEADVCRRICTRLAKNPGDRVRMAEALLKAGGPEAASIFESACAEFEAKRYPRQLMFATTYRCNLSCPYCYAMCLADNFPEDLSLKNFLAALDWMEENGYRLAAFTGGEPSLNPHFPRFLDELRKRAIRCYFATNMLFPTAVRDLIGSDLVQCLMAHICPKREYGPNQWELLHKNLQTFTRTDLNLIVRYNIEPESEGDFDELFDLCETYEIGEINYALIFPDRSALNMHFDTDHFAEAAGLVEKFVRQAEERGLRTRTTKPFPPCRLTQQQIRLLAKHEGLMSVCTIGRNGYTHNLIVNPDMALLPCIAVGKPGLNLFDFNKARPLDNLFKDEILAMTRRPLYPECPGCDLYERLLCQGACLSYKALEG